ncbi:MAG: hypothetical protein ACLQDL_08460 [Spirochaetia bacterium]
MKKLLFLVALTLIATAAFSQGMPRDSVVLGERTVDFHADHDVIPVGDYQGWFKDIGFWVERNNIEIFNLEVTYGDGQKQRLETRFVFDARNRSRLIHLEGEKRRIQSISFTFRTVGNWFGGKARVVVFGVK